MVSTPGQVITRNECLEEFEELSRDIIFLLSLLIHDKKQLEL